MDIDPREQKRRAWRIIGHAVWKDLIAPGLFIAGLTTAVFLCGWIWSIHPLLLILPVATTLVVLVGSLVWDWAKDRARIELTHEKFHEATREYDQ